MARSLLCTVVGIRCCCGFVACCQEHNKLSTEVTCHDEDYRIIVDLVDHLHDVISSDTKSAELVGNCLQQVYGMPPPLLHNHLSRLHLPGFAVVDALRRMLIGQCVVLNIETSKTIHDGHSENSHAVQLTATDIQLTGDGCQTILSYPPFSKPHNASYLECSQTDHPTSTSLSCCASLTSMYLLMSPSQPAHTSGHAEPTVVSPSQPAHSSGDAEPTVVSPSQPAHSSGDAEPTVVSPSQPAHSSGDAEPTIASPSQQASHTEPTIAHQYLSFDGHTETENTPELFSPVNPEEKLPSRTNTNSVRPPILHSTPQLKHSKHHSPKNLFLNPELV